jgi:hypothetical protein
MRIRKISVLVSKKITREKDNSWGLTYGVSADVGRRENWEEKIDDLYQILKKKITARLPGG